MGLQPEPPQFGQSLEGQQFSLTDVKQREHVIELAFDYRGDVTLELRSGEHLEGYVYHRDSHVSSPVLKLFPKDQAGTREVEYNEIVSILFSGEDTAVGKSWEDWVKKKQQELGK